MTSEREAQIPTPDQALNVFKMYEDKGWAVKQQMVAGVTWLTPIVFGLLGFSSKDCFSPPTSSTSVASAFVALLISLFMVFLSLMSLWHANSDYEIAHKIMIHAKDSKLLEEETAKILIGNRADGKSILKRLGFEYIGPQFIGILVFCMVTTVASLSIFARLSMGLPACFSMR